MIFFQASHVARSTERLELLSSHLEVTVRRLESDLSHVTARMTSLERLVALNKPCQDHVIQVALNKTNFAVLKFIYHVR